MSDQHPRRWWARWRKVPTTPPSGPTSATTPDEVAARILAQTEPSPPPGQESSEQLEQPEEKDGPFMKHTDAHYEKVAKLYLKYGSIAKVQNRFPNYSESSVRRWVAECRKRGLLPATAAKKSKK